MTEPTTGETLSVDDRLAVLDKKLSEYTDSLGLPSKTVAKLDEVDEILNKTRDQINKMLRADCESAAIFLLNFNFFLQKAINKESRIVAYCEANITKIIAPRMNQQQAYSAGERRELAIRENDVANKFDKLRVAALLRVTETQFLVNRIQASAEAYKDAARSRREIN